MVVAYGLTMISMRFAVAGDESAAARSRRSKSLVKPVRCSDAVLEEATLAEVVEQAAQRHGHRGDDGPEGDRALLARDPDVHAPDGGDERQRQQDDAEGGEHAEGLVAS